MPPIKRLVLSLSVLEEKHILDNIANFVLQRKADDLPALLTESGTNLYNYMM